MASSILSSASVCNLFTRLSKCKNWAVLKAGHKVLESSKTDTAPPKPRRGRGSHLKEINKTYNLIEPGLKVLDIGAAPGSWSRFLADRTNSNGKEANKQVGLVISIDIKDFEEIEGVHCLPNMDFLKESSQAKILEILGEGKTFDLILSDLVLPSSGVRSYDNMKMTKTILCLYIFIVKHLRRGGSCMLNIEGLGRNGYVKSTAQQLFKEVNYPEIIRSSTVQTYLVGKEFVGVKNT